MPIEADTVFYSSKRIMMSGDGVTGLFDALIHSEEGAKRTHIICVRSYGKRFDNFCAAYEQYENIRFVSYNTKEYIKAVMTAETVVSDGILPSYFVRREGQKHINLFNRKLFNLENSEIKEKNIVMTHLQRNLGQTSHITASTERELKLLDGILNLGGFYGGKVIKAVMPYYTTATVDTEEEQTEQFTEDASEENVVEEESEADTEVSEEAEDFGKTEDAQSVVSVDYPVFEQWADLESDGYWDTEVIEIENPLSEEDSRKNIIDEIFCDGGQLIPFEKNTKKKILVVAKLNDRNPFVSQLCNILERVDYTKAAITILAYDTSKAAVCRSLNPNVRVIIRKGYLFAGEEQRGRWNRHHSEYRSPVGDIDEYFETADRDMWRTEAERSTGSADYDRVILAGEAEPYWLTFVDCLKADSKLLMGADEQSLIERCVNTGNLRKAADRIFDGIILSDTSAAVLNTEKISRLETAYAVKLREAISEKAQALTAAYGGKEYEIPYPMGNSVFGCLLVPSPDETKKNYFCCTGSGADAFRAAKAFTEFAGDRKDVRLYLFCTEETDIDSAEDRIILVWGNGIPLLLMSRCDCFADPYGIYELDEFARLSGMNVCGREAEKPLIEASRLLRNGVKSLYRSYKVEFDGEFSLGAEDFAQGERSGDSGYPERAEETAIRTAEKIFG
jgi:hypothetical protein